MSWKKTAALICAAAMMMTAIAGCGEKKEETAADSSPAAEMGMAAEEGGIEEIVFATPLSKTVDMAPIEAELNKILEEKTLEDGSVVMKLIKQYNQSPVGDYLD